MCSVSRKIRPVDRAGGVEDPVAVAEAAIAEGDEDVALGHELPVEVRDPFVGTFHPVASSD